MISAAQSEISYNIQYLIGNRKANDLVKYLNTLDFRNSLTKKNAMW